MLTPHEMEASAAKGRNSHSTKAMMDRQKPTITDSRPTMINMRRTKMPIILMSKLKIILLAISPSGAPLEAVSWTFCHGENSVDARRRIEKTLKRKRRKLKLHDKKLSKREKPLIVSSNVLLVSASTMQKKNFLSVLAKNMRKILHRGLRNLKWMARSGLLSFRVIF